MEYYRMIFLKKGKNKILHHVPLIYWSYKWKGGQKKPDIGACATWFHLYEVQNQAKVN